MKALHFHSGTIVLEYRLLAKGCVRVQGGRITAVDSGLTETTVKAGPDGSAAWTPPAPGCYSIYVRDTLKQAGTLDGKAYEEIREFATLALTWPLEHREADP